MSNLFGDGNDAGWIVVYVIVALLIIGALIAIARRKKHERDHAHAEALRKNARRASPRLEQKEAEARKLEAESHQARAEADRLESAAQDRRAGVERDKARHTEKLREADRIDPEVDVEKNDDGPRHLGR